MATPTVTETFIALEPVTRDDFADSLPSARELEPPTKRDLVILSLGPARGSPPSGAAVTGAVAAIALASRSAIADGRPPSTRARRPRLS